MKDRKPKYPGRVLLTPEDGSAPFYAVLTRADEPYEDGDPMNVNTFLKDSTAESYGLDDTALPDDVLKVIKAFIDGRTRLEVVSYVGTGTYGEAEPNSLTFPFPVHMAIMLGYDHTPLFGKLREYLSGTVENFVMSSALCDETFRENLGFCLFSTNATDCYNKGRVTNGGKTYEWYTVYTTIDGVQDSSDKQLNVAGTTYYVLAIGKEG